jgi:hypothetical protein
VDEETWQASERRALRTLLRWVDPPGPLATLDNSLPPALRRGAAIDAQIDAIRREHRLEPLLWRACTLGPSLFCLQTWLGVADILRRRLALAMRGDRAALRWWPPCALLVKPGADTSKAGPSSMVPFVPLAGATTKSPGPAPNDESCLLRMCVLTTGLLTLPVGV